MPQTLQNLKTQVAFAKAMRDQLAKEKELHPPPANPYVDTDPITQSLMEKIEIMDNRLRILDNKVNIGTPSETELPELFKELQAVDKDAHDLVLKDIDTRLALLEGRTGPAPLKPARDALYQTLQTLMTQLDSLEAENFRDHLDDPRVKSAATTLTEQVKLVIALLKNSDFQFDEAQTKPLIRALENRFLYPLSPNASGQVINKKFPVDNQEASFKELLSPFAVLHAPTKTGFFGKNPKDLEKAQIKTSYLTVAKLNQLNNPLLLRTLTLVDSQSTLSPTPTPRSSDTSPPPSPISTPTTPKPNIPFKSEPLSIDLLSQKLKAYKDTSTDLANKGMEVKQLQSSLNMMASDLEKLKTLSQDIAARLQALSTKQPTQEELIPIETLESEAQGLAKEINRSLIAIGGNLEQVALNYQSEIRALPTRLAQHVLHLNSSLQKIGQALPTSAVESWKNALETNPNKPIQHYRESYNKIEQTLTHEHAAMVNQYISTETTKIEAVITNLQQVAATKIEKNTSLNPYISTQKKALEVLNDQIKTIAAKRAQVPGDLPAFKKWLQEINTQLTQVEKTKQRVIVLSGYADKFERQANTVHYQGACEFMKKIKVEIQTLIDKGTPEETDLRIKTLEGIYNDFYSSTITYIKATQALLDQKTPDPSALKGCQENYRKVIESQIEKVLEEGPKLSEVGIFSSIRGILQTCFRGDGAEIKAKAQAGDFSYLQTSGPSSKASKAVGSALEALQKSMKTEVGQVREQAQEQPKVTVSPTPRRK
ncbi:MAG: hypothetical protein NTW08_08795 [Gammaproteobacteria bacterium]|nr:hypothetical protein [Gammaproteobacteria bacterium]